MINAIYFRGWNWFFFYRTNYVIHWYTYNADNRALNTSGCPLFHVRTVLNFAYEKLAEHWKKDTKLNLKSLNSCKRKNYKALLIGKLPNYNLCARQLSFNDLTLSLVSKAFPFPKHFDLDSLPQCVTQFLFLKLRSLCYKILVVYPFLVSASSEAKYVGDK